MKTSYILEFFDKRTKQYQYQSDSTNLERLKITAKKSYLNYWYIGRKRIRRIQSDIIWRSKNGK